MSRGGPRALAIVTALGLATAATSTATAEPRSLKTAYTLSGVGTGASAALFFAAFMVSEREGDVNLPLVYAGLGSLLVTPSLGQFYAGQFLTPGLGVRAAAAALATWAVLEYQQVERCDTPEFMECTGLEREAVAFLGIAAIAYVGGAALDFKDLPDSVAETNRRRGYFISPTIVPALNRDRGASSPIAGALLGVVGAF